MTDSPASVLIVEDDEPVRSFLADNLTADGYEVLLAGGIRDAVRQLEYKKPDVVLLDINLPDGSGLEVLRRTREADGVASRLDPGTPFLVLSGHAGELERVRCFERGADDFLPKPFSYPELRLRVQAVLRRTRRRQTLGSLRVGTLELDPVSREVHVGGVRVELAQKEFALLRALATEPTRVFTKEELLRDVWGFRAMGTTRTLDSHACRLRQKLAVHGERFVLNVWGVGYRLVDAVPASSSPSSASPAMWPARRPPGPVSRRVVGWWPCSSRWWRSGRRPVPIASASAPRRPPTSSAGRCAPRAWRSAPWSASTPTSRGSPPGSGPSIRSCAARDLPSTSSAASTRTDRGTQRRTRAASWWTSTRSWPPPSRPGGRWPRRATRRSS